MKTSLVILLVLLAALPARADSFFPDTPGTSWEYGQTGAEPSNFTIRIAGREKSKGKDLLKFETTAGGQVIQVQLISASDRGVLCHKRQSTTGQTDSFDPPRVLLPIPLQVGTTWELEDDVAGVAMHQVFKIVAEEDVTVPAGYFRAYHLHCEQPWPLSISVDRWFAPGTGFVKDTTTTRGPTGRLLSRVTTVLTKFSIAPPAPESPPSAKTSSTPAAPGSPPKIAVEIAKERDGESTTSFRSDAPNIYVHWQGANLSKGSVVRVAWIAEDVGEVADPNFIVDETETEIISPESGARFTLSRPSDGWATGKYRLEVYLDDVLIEKVAVSITE
jgi:hypothetical protein